MMAQSMENDLPVIERHFTVAELEEVWHVSAYVLRRWFRNEPGVVKFGKAAFNDRRSYVCLRIPESVARRVYLRNMNLSEPTE